MGRIANRVVVGTSTLFLIVIVAACSRFDSDTIVSAGPDGGVADGAQTPTPPVTGVGISTPPPDGGRDGGPADASVDSSPLEIHEFCVQEVNKHRASIGVAPLTRWLAKEPCVDGQAMADYTADATHSTVGACAETGQAACKDWPSSDQQGTIRDCAQAMWNEGPGDFATHSNYETLAKPTFTKVACGIFITPSGRLWAELDFQ